MIVMNADEPMTRSYIALLYMYLKEKKVKKVKKEKKLEGGGKANHSIFTIIFYLQKTRK